MTWHERIDRAELRGGFTMDERVSSGNWITCACGEQDPRIPRGSSDGCSSEPKDDVLGRLGTQFCLDVNNNNFHAARETLAAIEKRAAEILRGME